MNHREIVKTSAGFLSFAIGTVLVLAFVFPKAGKSAPPEKLSIRRDELTVGYKTNAGKYALVEFMDYECPPCKAKFPYVESYLKSESKSVDFVPRNFPLSFHKSARPAALLALALKESDPTLDAHKMLMEKQGITPEYVKSLAKERGIDLGDKALAAALESDVALGKRVKVEGTPTFLLCTPAGDVYKLRDLSQLDEFIK